MKPIEWQTIFQPGTSPLEIILRGTIMYLGIFFLLRVVLKRQSGSFSVTDTLLIVLIADASQNGMTGDYKSVTDGLILVVTLIFWNFALDWLSYKVPAFDRLITPPPIQIIKEGRLLRKNMRKEYLTKDDVMGHLREDGIDSVEKVKEAYIEGDGAISVIKYDDSESQKPKEKNAGAG